MRNVLLVWFVVVFASAAQWGCSAVQNRVIQSVDLKDGANPTDFALFLYKAMFNENKNVVLSPFSARLLLHTIYPFGEAHSQSGLAKVLGMRNAQEVNLRILHDSNTRLQQIRSKRAVDIRSSNVVWLTATEISGQCTQAVVNDTVKVVEANARNRAQIREEINAWVAQNTGGYIRDFVTPQMIAELRPLAANATYFNGKWASPFESDGAMMFQTGDRGRIMVEAMIRGEESGRYFETPDVKVFDLPYQGGDVVMMLILPKHPGNLAKVTDTLTDDKLEGLRKGMVNTTLKVRMPKFRVENFIPLTETLNVHPGIFTSPCDFCFCQPPEFCLDEIFQKAVIEVDEEGTVAAAVTMAADSWSPALEPILVSVDRPFIYLIRDQETGEIYFMGHVVNPEQ